MRPLPLRLHASSCAPPPPPPPPPPSLRAAHAHAHKHLHRQVVQLLSHVVDTQRGALVARHQHRPLQQLCVQLVVGALQQQTVLFQRSVDAAARAGGVAGRVVARACVRA